MHHKPFFIVHLFRRLWVMREGERYNIQQFSPGYREFTKEGWCLAELFYVCYVVAAPYTIPYSAPTLFERHFRKELSSLYEYLQEAPIGKVCWNDVIHWMWPPFNEDWGLWRSDDLNLSPCLFADLVTGLPLWFLPTEWRFSCSKCIAMAALISSRHLNATNELCSAHAELKSFLKSPMSKPPVFVSLSSIGSMGFLRNPRAFLQVLQSVLESTSYRFILFSAGYDPLNDAVRAIFPEVSSSLDPKQFSEDGCTLFSGRMFFFSGAIPYNWLFPRCEAAVHHGGSGSTAAALRAGIPQVICPFLLDQFYWAERMFWLGVASKPLKRNELLPDKNDHSSISEAASALSGAIDYALSPQVKACAAKLAEKISLEDGVLEAVKILKEELSCPNFDK